MKQHNLVRTHPNYTLTPHTTCSTPPTLFASQIASLVPCASRACVKANEYFEWIDESSVASHSQVLHEGQLVWSAVHVLLRGEASVADGSGDEGGDLGEASGSGAQLLMDAPPTCSKNCSRDPRCPKPASHRGHCKLKGDDSGSALAPVAASGFTTTEEPIASELHDSDEEVEVEVVEEEEEEEVEVQEADEEEEEEVEVEEVEEVEEEASSQTGELDPSIPAATRHVNGLSDAAEEERTAEAESGSQVAVEQEIAADPKPSSFAADAADAVDAAGAEVEEAGSFESSKNQESQGGVAVGLSDAVEECEGRSRRKRKPVDHVSARVSNEISNEMERPQLLKKVCVLRDAEPTTPAGAEAVSEQARPSSPLAPMSSGRLRIAPGGRLRLAVPLYGKCGSARGASRRKKSALDDGGSDGDDNGDGNGLWDNAVAEDASAPVEDASAAVDRAAHRITLQRPDCGEGRSRRERKPVDYVSARVSNDIKNEKERPQLLKKACVLQKESEEAAAEVEAAEAQPQGRTTRKRKGAAPTTNAEGLPDGWVSSTHVTPSGQQYKRYKGPGGGRAQSLKQAWVLHDAEPTSPAGPEAVSAPVAASEVDDELAQDHPYWAEVEVVVDELVQDHPQPSELIGADVCVMAAAYPKDALSRRRAVGWRGLVTHTRGGASEPQVR